MTQRAEPSVLDPLERREAAGLAPGDVLQEHPLDRILGAVGENLLSGGLDECRAHRSDTLGRKLATVDRLRFRAMPIHVRANKGDYAEACLLPGDPLRAKYIAETFMEDVVQRNSERGMLGYTGTFGGKPVSVQSSGMGCPSAAIVIEELVQLGVTKLMRVGTCGGLQPDLSMGDLIIALSATPADSTATHYVLGEPHAPTADFGLVHEAVHQAKHLGKPVRVGPIVSSDIFYQPDPGLAGRWSERGILAVEMEAAILFTLGALRKVQAGCMLIVSDIVVEGEFVRITDDEMKAAVDQMTELALHVVTAA
jgi:DeoD family purine-nucleoside phosphorylase